MAPRAHTTTTPLAELQQAITRLAPGELADLLSWVDDLRDRVGDSREERSRESDRVDALLAEIADELDGAPLQTA